ncbi:hypothetical protein [Erythrobacter sp.]|uniref:hypothetical protein n=1 Tax=Erythrobacter sp. TaxID=1042 RepID=UPI00345B6D56
MREQLCRAGETGDVFAFELRPCQRHDQRADIEQGRHGALVEARFEPRHGGGERELHIVGQGLLFERAEHLSRKRRAVDRDASIRRQPAPDRGIARIIGGIEGDKRVGVIVPAKQEHADQRLVAVAARKGRRVGQAGQAERIARCRPHHRELPRSPHEGAARYFPGLADMDHPPLLYFCTR